MAYNDLKELLNQYNWDDGFEIPKEILKNRNCDLALALEIFYLADGYNPYLKFFCQICDCIVCTQIENKRGMDEVIRNERILERRQREIRDGRKL